MMNLEVSCTMNPSSVSSSMTADPVCVIVPMECIIVLHCGQSKLSLDSARVFGTCWFVAPRATSGRDMHGGLLSERLDYNAA